VGVCLSGGCVRAVGRAAKAFLSTTCGDSASPTSVSTNDRIFSVSPASWSSRTWFSTSSAACFRFSYSFWPKARIMMRHNERERGGRERWKMARQKRYSYMTPSAEYQYSPVRRRMSAASAPLAGSSTTSALLSASLLRPTAATALDSLHRQRTLLSSPSSVIMLLSLCDGRPYTLKLAKAAETGGETDTTQPQIRFVRLTLSGFPSRIWMRLLRSLLTVEYTHLITTSRLLKLIMIILSTHSN